MNPIFYMAAAFIVWNIITFFLFGIDKSKAKKGKWRINEAVLITCAFLMGGMGSLLGMLIFRHKTRHLKFKLLVPLALVVNIGFVVLLYYAGLLHLSGIGM